MQTSSPSFEGRKRANRPASFACFLCSSSLWAARFINQYIVLCFCFFFASAALIYPSIYAMPVCLILHTIESTHRSHPKPSNPTQSIAPLFLIPHCTRPRRHCRL